ncbi:LysR family transcriptional regulator [Kordiimonas aquimaris]|uniref:LysR family transcriptional regulator n=1 Tax=Kordiimonas aquimaris TaxID=707591 RepID=UPI0021D2A64E|nr:LysR family transcriptional regulator [Kordiimonas aquimaris]
MDIKWIEDFLHLVETKNFSLAAEKRCVTQSAYSRRIRALENWIGAELFDRSSIPIKITEQGQKFLPYAEKVLADINQIQAKFRPHSNPIKNEIKIITQHSLMLHFLPDFFMSFDFKNTKMNVTSNLNSFESYFEDITTGSSDLFISYEVPDLHKKLIAVPHIKSIVVGSENMVPVVSSQFKDKFNWETSGTIPHLTLNNRAFITAIVRDKLMEHYEKLDTVYEANLSESLLQMAKQGKGVTWLPYCVCKNELDAGNIMVLEGPNLVVPSNIIAYVNSKNADTVTRKLWQHMQHQVQ